MEAVYTFLVRYDIQPLDVPMQLMYNDGVSNAGCTCHIAVMTTGILRLTVEPQHLWIAPQDTVTPSILKRSNLQFNSFFLRLMRILSLHTSKPD